MNVYNPLDSMKRLEAAGLERRHAEAIAAELGESKSDLVTNESLDLKLDAALNRQLVRFGVLISGLIAVATAIVSVFSRS